MQGVKVNVLEGSLLVLALHGVLPGTALGLSHPQPVGGLIRGAGEVIALDEGFEQINGMAVFALPVGAQTTGNPAENMVSYYLVCGQDRRSQPAFPNRFRSDSKIAWPG